MNYRDIILSDPINRWCFEHLKSDVFLIGGYVRDLIIGRKSADKDYVAGGDIEKLARDMAREFEGKAIYISRYNIFRVITRKREFIDITPLGRNIKSNLQKRDFTINAIAWSPKKDIIDPLNGISDISDRVIRIANKNSLADDPLRCLRVFRFAADLDFNIHRDTLNECEKNSGNLSGVAAERKTDEFIKLLNNVSINNHLDLMLEFKVMNEISTLNYRFIKHNISMVRRVDNFIDKVRIKHPDIYNSLNLKRILMNEISQGMSGHCLLRMAILTYGDKSEEIHVKGLSLSNIINKRIHLIHSALRESTGMLTKHRLFNVLKVAGKCSQQVALILSAIKRDFSMDYLKRAQDLMRFINEKKVDGYDIQREMKITKGEHVGHMKDAIYRKWFLRELETRQDIISFIRSNLT